MDMISRLFIASTGSFLAPVSFSAFPFAAPCSCLTDAPYPASSTAFMITPVSVVFSSNSTCMLLVSRLTLTFVTPSTLLTLFSTWEEHAEQDIPVTSKFSFIISSFAPFFPYFISFFNNSHNSSTASSFPSLISSETQVFMCLASSSLLKLFNAACTADTCVKISTQ